MRTERRAASESRDALVASIARVVRSEHPDRLPGETELNDAISKVLTGEAARNEFLLARARAGVTTGYAALALLVHFRPELAGLAEYPPTDALFGVAWGALALLLLPALRRGWYRDWLRQVLPLADALAVLAGFALVRSHAQHGVALGTDTLPAAAGAAGVLCALLAFSGALRLTKPAVRLSATAAVVTALVVSVLAPLAPAQGLALVAATAAAGWLAFGVTSIVRRVLTTEVGRVTLERLYMDARQAADAREEVLKIVSHDLRNPLSTISMGTTLMLETSLSDELRQKQLRVIQRAGERMQRLIQDLLSVARLEAGRLSVDARPTNTSALIAEAVEMLGPLVREKGLRLDVGPTDGLPAVQADPGRVQQVIGNLVGNAVKFTPRGGVVSLGAEAAGPMVYFVVGDTGPGIPADQLPHVFRKLWQARRSDGRGIGLGLAIAKGIVEAHGGTIGVESQVGRGTQFTFSIPSSSEEPAPMGMLTAEMAAWRPPVQPSQPA